MARVRRLLLTTTCLLVACGSDVIGAQGESGPTDATPARADAASSDGPESDGAPDGDASAMVDATKPDGAVGDAAVGDANDAADASVNDDPFDPLACGGTPLKGTELLARVGTMAKVLGNTKVHYRSRSCTSKGVGCGAFIATDIWVERIDGSGQSIKTDATSQLAVYPWPSPATSGWVYLGGPNYPGSPITTSSAYDHVTCAVDENRLVSCGDYAIVFSTFGSTLMGSLKFRYASTPLRLKGKITETCLQLAASAGAAPIGPWVDEEVAVLHRWSPAL